jgi:UDP-glucose 4-epimerase
MQNNSLAGRRIFVTGGAGFIGSRLVDQACRAGAEVGIFDNLSVRLPMLAARPGLTTTEGDIRDATAIAAAIAAFAPDTVIHLAAVHHIPTCERQRAYSLEVNVVGTENVLAACEAAGVGHLVLASTGAVYAWGEEALVEDSSPLGSSDNYSVAKLANESQCRFWADRTGSRLSIARIFNTIGWNDPNAHLIPDILDQLAGGATTATLRLGNLKPRRDYIFVEDTAAGLLAMATRNTDNAPQVDIFNVCTGDETSVEDLVRMIGSVTGVALTIEQDPDRVRRVDRISQVGDAGKAKSVFGWQAAASLRQAVERIVGDTRAAAA